MKLKYTGLSHVRSFRKSDFTRHGLEGGEAVSFDESNNWTAEVDDSVAEWLIANDGEFREANDDDESTPDFTRAGSQGRIKGMPVPQDDLPVGATIESPTRTSPGAVESGGGTRGSARGGSTARSRS